MCVCVCVRERERERERNIECEMEMQSFSIHKVKKISSNSYGISFTRITNSSG